MDEFGLTEQTMGGWTVLSISGELDAATGPALRQAIVDQLAAHMALVIDMSAITFLDSSGLGVLVSTLKRVREVDGHLTLVIASENVHNLMRITALDLVFTIVSTLQEAVASPPAEPVA